MSIKVKLENAKVTKHLSTTGFQVEVPVAGQDWTRRFTIWSHSQPAVDSLLTITGELSWKQREYEVRGETKHTVDMNVNNPELTITYDPSEAPF